MKRRSCASDPRYRWVLDQLAILRTGGELRIGFVTRVALGADGQLGAEGQLALTLRMWSGNPVAMTLLPLSAASADDPPLPALRFDETPDDKASLVLPPRTYNPSRVLRSLDVVPIGAPSPSGLRQRGVGGRFACDETADEQRILPCRTVAPGETARTSSSTPPIPSTGSPGVTKRWRRRAGRGDRSCCR
jgi:hypothetical protein